MAHMLPFTSATYRRACPSDNTNTFSSTLSEKVITNSNFSFLVEIWYKNIYVVLKQNYVIFILSLFLFTSPSLSCLSIIFIFFQRINGRTLMWFTMSTARSFLFITMPSGLLGRLTCCRKRRLMINSSLFCSFQTFRYNIKMHAKRCLKLH